jgi:hypothetical protein
MAEKPRYEHNGLTSIKSGLAALRDFDPADDRSSVAPFNNFARA